MQKKCKSNRNVRIVIDDDMHAKYAILKRVDCYKFKIVWKFYFELSTMKNVDFCQENAEK